MRASDLATDARRAGLAWAVGVLDAAGAFRVDTRRRVVKADTPVDIHVEVSCHGDVGAALTNVLGGAWTCRSDGDGRTGKWRLRAGEVADVLETVIPLMRCAARVRAAQGVLGVRYTKSKAGTKLSEHARAARIEAVGR